MPYIQHNMSHHIHRPTHTQGVGFIQHCTPRGQQSWGLFENATYHNCLGQPIYKHLWVWPLKCPLTDHPYPPLLSPQLYITFSLVFAGTTANFSYVISLPWISSVYILSPYQCQNDLSKIHLHVTPHTELFIAFSMKSKLFPLLLHQSRIFPIWLKSAFPATQPLPHLRDLSIWSAWTFPTSPNYLTSYLTEYSEFFQSAVLCLIHMPPTLLWVSLNSLNLLFAPWIHL